MKPIRTRIAGFGPHRDTTIDWSALAPVAAIVGANGNGKTYLIEAPVAALYGEFPSYPGSLYDAMTQGGTGESELQHYFEERGQRYLATRDVRDTGKTQTHAACLYRLNPDDTFADCDSQGDPAPLAGPKVGDFNAKVRALFGDAPTALATWASVQGAKGDLCNALPSKRREVFAELLGFGELDKRAEKFGEAAKAIEAEVKLLAAQLVGLPDFDALASEAKASVEKAKSEIDGGRLSIAQAEERLGKLRTRIAELTAAAPELESLKREESSLAERVASLEKAIVRDAAAKDKAQANSAGLAEAEAAEATLPNLRAEVADLEERDRLHREFDKWLAESRRLDTMDHSARHALESAAIDLSEAALTNDELSMLANADAIAAEANDAKSKSDAVKLANSARVAERSRLRNVATNAETRILEIEAKIKRRPETPFGEKCAPCPFLAEFAKLPAEAEAFREQAEKARAELAAVPQDETEVDVAEIAAKCERLRSARKRKEVLDSAEKKHAAARKSAGEALAALQAHLTARPAVGADDVAISLAEARRRLETSCATASRAEACRASLAEVARLDSAIATAKAELEPIKARLVDLRAKIKAESGGDAARQAELSEARVSVCAEESLLSIDRSAVERLVSVVAAKDSEIARLVKDKAEAEAKAAERDAKAVRARRLRTLQTVFGRKGVQPILIDAAAPELEAHAAEIVRRLTDGKRTLRFATQDVNGDGALREDFLILGSDDRGERDVSRFSGGEKRMYYPALRIAVLLWVAAMKGRSADCLLVDEGFDALDADNAERMVGVLRDLGNQFGRVVVVTHDGHLADRIGCSVRLQKTSIGVRLTVEN